MELDTDDSCNKKMIFPAAESCQENRYSLKKRALAFITDHQAADSIINHLIMGKRGEMLVSFLFACRHFLNLPLPITYPVK